MANPNEASSFNGKTWLSTWFRMTLLGFAAFVISGFTFLGAHIISNDIKYTDKISANETGIARLEVQYIYIRDDLGEIKELLKRKIP